MQKQINSKLIVTKPWGAYCVLDQGGAYKVKYLDVNPGQRLSLQSPLHRREEWTVVKGVATVTLDDEIVRVMAGAHITVPKQSKHRIENKGATLLRIIEVQTGTYLGEDDIIRYEDDYGR